MSANGYLRDDELEVVQGSGANAIRLSRPTAAIFRRMRTDAAKDGVTVTLVASYHGAAGYRSHATQVDMRVHPGLYNIGKGFGLPGLPSEHGWGTCMDIDQGLAWVKANGHRYGVTFPIASDHNHARWDGITLAGEIGDALHVEDDGTHIEPPKGLDMLGSIVGKVTGDGSGMTGAWFQMAPGVIVCWDALTGAYQATLINVDTFAERAAASGVPVEWSLKTVQWEAHGVGAPNGTLERLYVAADVEQKIWRAGDGVPTVTIDPAALKTLFAPLADKIDALDAKATGYQAELEKLLTAGLTGTVTLTPAK